MITKATRFQIIKPLDASWEEFGKALNDISYNTTRMCNAAVQMYWEYHNQRLAYKMEHGEHSRHLRGGGSVHFRNIFLFHTLNKCYP